MPGRPEPTMELRHLPYLRRVRDAASVLDAASRVHVSQPALSRQIRDLETELGVRLFDRVGRRIQLIRARLRDERAHDDLAGADLAERRLQSFDRALITRPPSPPAS